MENFVCSIPDIPPPPSSNTRTPLWSRSVQIAIFISLHVYFNFKKKIIQTGTIYNIDGNMLPWNIPNCFQINLLFFGLYSLSQTRHREVLRPASQKLKFSAKWHKIIFIVAGPPNRNKGCASKKRALKHLKPWEKVSKKKVFLKDSYLVF